MRGSVKVALVVPRVQSADSESFTGVFVAGVLVSSNCLDEKAVMLLHQGDAFGAQRSWGGR